MAVTQGIKKAKQIMKTTQMNYTAGTVSRDKAIGVLLGMAQVVAALGSKSSMPLFREMYTHAEMLHAKDRFATKEEVKLVLERG